MDFVLLFSLAFASLFTIVFVTILNHEQNAISDENESEPVVLYSND